MNNLQKYVQQSLLSVGLLFLFSCTNNDNTKPPVQAETKKDIAKQTTPFSFYKDLAVRPGLNFEVVSWGKGVDSLGGYLLLMSDSLKNDFRSTSVEREGILQDAWNMDMDNDGNPELYVELLKNQNQRDLNVFEFSRGSFQRISFPSIPDRLKKIYGGNDKFSIKDGELYRSFPIVNPRDSTEKAGDLKVVRYTLSGNSFSVKEVKEEE
jgi:hypothetical protein